MNELLLSNFSFADTDTVFTIRDAKSFELATAAQQAAETAGATATAAQQAAETAGAAATAAQQAADGIIAGFNTQFDQIPSKGNLIAPYYCKRNNTIYFEFPNIPFLGTVQANTWTQVFTLPEGYRPLSTCYRVLAVGGTSTMLVELSASGAVKVFPVQTFTSAFAIFGGFSFLTI